MEFQTHATAGRISEIIGERAINYDREQRRMGLTYAAENMVRQIEADEKTRSAVENYTAGVNAFIENMTDSELPIEYKLLDYRPERWTTLKTALFIKQLTKTLAGYGYSNDFQYSNLRRIFSREEMNLLFPFAPDSLSPIIPKGTVYPEPLARAVAPEDADSVYFRRYDSLRILQTEKQTPGVGSNNWAVSGSKTASGFPILCNDPHLDLTVPAIWYELQMNTPTMNAYGTSFPGIPGVVIGFNDSIAFGFTNGGIDVMDFYEIRFRDDSKKQYWHKGGWKDSRLRVEAIQVRGGPTVYDTVAYSVFGPVMYDKSFTRVS
jgi:penicillin amidase